MSRSLSPNASASRVDNVHLVEPRLHKTKVCVLEIYSMQNTFTQRNISNVKDEKEIKASEMNPKADSDFCSR